MARGLRRGDLGQGGVVSRADLLARRDAAALVFEVAQAAYQTLGDGATWRTLEDARKARRNAADDVDNADFHAMQRSAS